MKISIFIEKITNFRKVCQLFFSKLFFDKKKIIFFDGIFFQVHLDIQENRFEAIPERFHQSKCTKTRITKKIYRKKDSYARFLTIKKNNCYMHPTRSSGSLKTVLVWFEDAPFLMCLNRKASCTSLPGRV